MAKMHVLEGTALGSYTIVVHTTTPAGNNSAGVAWPAAIVAAGRNTSVMTIGTGAGQIAQAEHDQIVAGTVIEGVFSFVDDPSWTPTQRNAALDAMATQMTTAMLAELATRLKWIGATRS